MLSVEPADDVINPSRFPRALTYKDAIVLLPPRGATVGGVRMECALDETPDGRVVAVGRVFGTRVVLGPARRRPS